MALSKTEKFVNYSLLGVSVGGLVAAAVAKNKLWLLVPAAGLPIAGGLGYYEYRRDFATVQVKADKWVNAYEGFVRAANQVLPKESRFDLKQPESFRATVWEGLATSAEKDQKQEIDKIVFSLKEWDRIQGLLEFVSSGRLNRPANQERLRDRVDSVLWLPKFSSDFSSDVSPCLYALEGRDKLSSLKMDLHMLEMAKGRAMFPKRTFEKRGSTMYVHHKVDTKKLKQLGQEVEARQKEIQEIQDRKASQEKVERQRRRVSWTPTRVRTRLPGILFVNRGLTLDLFSGSKQRLAHIKRQIPDWQKDRILPPEAATFATQKCDKLEKKVDQLAAAQASGRRLGKEPFSRPVWSPISGVVRTLLGRESKPSWGVVTTSPLSELLLKLPK